MFSSNRRSLNDRKSSEKEPQAATWIVEPDVTFRSPTAPSSTGHYSAQTNCMADPTHTVRKQK